MINSELNSIAQDNSLKLLDRDLTLIELGLPEISSDYGELLEEILIDTLTLPTVTQAFAFNEMGLPIKLELGSQKISMQKYLHQENIRLNLFSNMRG